MKPLLVCNCLDAMNLLTNFRENRGFVSFGFARNRPERLGRDACGREALGQTLRVEKIIGI